MTEGLGRPSNGVHQRTIAWIVGLAVAYDIGVLGLQLRDWVGSPKASASIGEYSSSIAVALCVVALILIRKMTQDPRLRVLSLAIAVVFTLLTLDDVFNIHERMNDDDYVAIFLWLFAGTVLLVLLRLERPGRLATAAICTGFFLHGIAALADGADGGIFTLSMISPFEIAWSQEIFAVAYLTLYLVGFSSMLVRHRPLENVSRAPSRVETRIGVSIAVPAHDAEDRDLSELEAWYWAWRSRVETAETDANGQRLIDEMLAVVVKLAASPAQSMIGVAAKLRVLQDMRETMKHFGRPEMDVDAQLLESVVSDSNRLAAI